MNGRRRAELVGAGVGACRGVAAVLVGGGAAGGGTNEKWVFMFFLGRKFGDSAFSL